MTAYDRLCSRIEVLNRGVYNPLILYPQEAKEILEALLLCSSEPLTLDVLSGISGYETGDIVEILDLLQQDYHEQGRGFEIREIAGGWMFATYPKHAVYIEKLVRPRITSLSQASLEVLSIIAYRQPVTRGEMEEIRGVNCDSPVNTLLERGLIAEAGRKDVPGRPIMFATTSDFLKYFGLSSLRELPELPLMADTDMGESPDSADNQNNAENSDSAEYFDSTENSGSSEHSGYAENSDSTEHSDSAENSGSTEYSDFAENSGSTEYSDTTVDNDEVEYA